MLARGWSPGVEPGAAYVEGRDDALRVERLRARVPQSTPPAHALEGATARRHVAAAVAEGGAEGAHELGPGTQRLLHLVGVKVGGWGLGVGLGLGVGVRVGGWGWGWGSGYD